jgi:hypothetical protein
MIVFYFHSFMNHIAIDLFTLPTMIAAKEKPTATMPVAIQSNPQFRPKIVVPHTWTIL